MASRTEDAKKRASEFAQRAVVELRKVNFAEGLGPTSVRTRRALLSLGVIAVISAIYDINLTRIPWLEIPAPAHAEKLVPVLLFGALIYHWLSFAAYGIADAIKWEAAIQTDVYQQRSQILYQLSGLLNQLTFPRQVPAEQVASISADVCDVLTSAAAEWLSFYRLSTFGFWWKRLMIWVWELAIPLLSAGFAACFLYYHRIR